jgi:hypothetical protein
MNRSIVFGLEFRAYDGVAEDGKEVVLTTPLLEVFASEIHAAAKKEGINISEGDLTFFAFDGSPLLACFSKEPFFHENGNTYFPGAYSLQRGSGEYLQDVVAICIAQNPSPHTRIVIRMATTDSEAQWYGWPDVIAMRDEVERALKLLPSQMQRRIVSYQEL